MSNWTDTTLGAFTDIRVSNVDKKTVAGEREVHLCNYMDVYSTNSVTSERELMLASATESEFQRFRLLPGDVVITKDSESPDDIAVPTYISEGIGDDVVCGYHLAMLRPKSGLNGHFLSYLLRLPQVNRHFSRTATGSTRYGLSLKALHEAPIRIPESELEQQGIAEVLSALDEQIKATDALIEKLTQRRKGLVQEHLLPVAATASTVALGDVCSVITSGSRGWAQYYAPEGDLFLRIGNLTRAHPNLRFDDVVMVKPPTGGEGQRTRLETGDVLISITADLGIIGCIPESLGSAYINQHIALARLSDTDLDPRWVAHALASPFGFEQISKLNDGGAKAGLNLPTIKALRVPKPSLETQKELAALLDAADEEIASEQALAEKLRLQKQGLMRDLLTGKTQVLQ